MEAGNPQSDTKRTLILFVKNKETGRVKTRLAKTIGDEKAMVVYQALIDHTKSILDPLPVHKVVYYSKQIPLRDQFPISLYDKEIQPQGDLGQKMAHAFQTQFRLGAKQVMIIGSDCPELTTEILEQGLQLLKEKDVVLGPAKDGGYYFLGMNSFHPQLFENKAWSTADVLLDTILDLDKATLTYHLLPTLGDVDYEEDLTDELRKLIQ